MSTLWTVCSLNCYWYLQIDEVIYFCIADIPLIHTFTNFVQASVINSPEEAYEDEEFDSEDVETDVTGALSLYPTNYNVIYVIVLTCMCLTVSYNLLISLQLIVLWKGNTNLFSCFTDFPYTCHRGIPVVPTNVFQILYANILKNKLGYTNTFKWS